MEIYNFWLTFGKSKNILRNYGFEEIYEIAKTTIDSEFINQFISIYSNHFNIKSVEDDKILIFIDKQPLTNETILKQYTKHLDPKFFMKHRNLKFNPTKYTCLNSWFGLKGPYEYEFLKSFSEKFDNYICYNNILEDYPKYKDYILNITLENYEHDLNNDTFFNNILINKIDKTIKINYSYTFKNEWYDFLEWALENKVDLSIILNN